MAKVAALGLLAVGVVVFLIGGAFWFVRNQRVEATKEARVACGFYREAAKPDEDKTETFVRFMLREAGKHAANAERMSDDYAGFGDGMAGVAARAGGDLDTLDVMAVSEVCGPI